MKFNNSIKYAIAFCFIALMSSNAWAQSIPVTENFIRQVGVLPTGWFTGGGSPDSVDELGSTSGGSYPFSCTPVDPNGNATWVYGVAAPINNSAGFASEAVSTNITGLTAGETYTVSGFVGNFATVNATATGGTGDIILTVGGTVSDTISFTNPVCEWKPFSVTFTVTGGTSTAFDLTTADNTGMEWHISVGSGAVQLAPPADTDGDGVADANEPGTQNNPCLPAQAAGYMGFDATNALWQAADCDGDGVNNGQEVINGTDPYTPSICSPNAAPPILIQN